MANVAQLGVRILIEDSASLGLGRISGALGTLGLNIHTLGDGLTGLDPKLKALGVTALASGSIFAGLVSVLKYTVEASAELGTAMSNMNVFVAGAADHAKKLQEVLINLSNVSIYSLPEVADGFSKLGLNGQNAEDIINGVGAAMVNLGQAINADAEPAAELLSTTMQVFNLKASDASHAADVLAFAFHNGQGSVENLQQALNQAGATVSAAKISVDDFAIALDILGQAGLKGSQAGSALNYAIQDLEAPTNKAANVFQQLGLIIVNKTAPALQQLLRQMQAQGGASKSAANAFDGTYSSLNNLYNAAKKAGEIPLNETFLQWADSTGIVTSKFYDAQTGTFDLKQAMEQLLESIKGITGPDGAPDMAAQADAIRDAFGVRAARGIQDFINKMSDVPGAWDALRTVLQDTSAVDLATEKTNNLASQWEIFTGSVRSLAGLLGSETNGPLITFIQHLNDLVSYLSNTDEGTRANYERLLIFATGISGAVFGLSSLAGVFEGLAPLMKGTGKGFGQIGQDIFDMLSFAQNIPLLGGYFRSIGPNVKNAGQDIKLLGTGLGDIGKGTGLGFLKSIVSAMMGVAGGAANSSEMLKVFGSPLADITSGAGQLAPALVGLVGDFFGLGVGIMTIVGPILLVIGIIAIIILLFTQFKAQGQQIVNMLITEFTPVWTQIQQTIQTVVGQIMVTWQGIQPQLKQAMTGLVEGFKQAKPFFDIIVFLLQQVVKWIGALVSGIVSGFLKALPFIIKAVTAIMTVLGGLGTFITKLLHGDIPGAFAGLGQVFVGLWNLISNLVRAVWEIVSNVVEAIIGFFVNLWDTLFGHSIMIDIQNAFILVFNTIAALGQWLFGVFIQPLISFFGLLWDGVTAGIQLGMNWFSNLLSFLSGILSWVRDTFIKPISDFFSGLWDGFRDGIDRVIGYFNNFRDGIKSAISAVLGPIKTLLDGLSKVPGVGGIFSGILGILNSIHLAQGGVVTRPMLATIGEGGEPEAVIPLSKLFGFMLGIQNQQAAQNANTTFYLLVDGKTVTKVVHNQVTGALTLSGAGRVLK